MKTFFQLKEELDTSLYEMEMLTHKKKIKAAEDNVRKVLAKHDDAAKKVYATAEKHWEKMPENKKNDENHPSHKPMKAHAAVAKSHKQAALPGRMDRINTDHPTYLHKSAEAARQSGNSPHVDRAHHRHAVKLHNELVDAHNELVAAKKASPLNKAKSVVHKFAKKIGVTEAKESVYTNEGYESNRIKKAAIQRLSQGTGTKHSGHDGMATYHASMADKYKGTEAGKHHQRASDHHARAVNALRKGNINGGLTHAKNALDAAKAAHNSHNSRYSEAGKSDSMSLYYDHKSDVNAQRRAKERDDEYAQRDKPKRSDRPIARAIGKTKSKVKKVLRMGEEVEQVDENYGAMKDAEAHAKRDGKNYNDVSVQHKYDAYHMKKRGYTHFTPSRYGGRTYHKGSAGYDSERIEPHHYSGISESWKTVGRTPDGNYKIQRDTETGARRKVPAQMQNEETPTGKQVKQAIGIARDKRYAKGNMTGAVKTMNKINPKLSNHPRVKDELQKQNEDAISKLRNESKQVNEILPALATVARVAAPAVARAGVKTLGRVATGAARGAAKAVAPAVGAYAAKKVVDKTRNEDKAADRDALQKAMDVFKKRGGKITKVAPGKAAGYHGKDDPGQDMHGMMDKGDTKAIGTRKKVKSMGEAKQTHMFDNEKDARAKAKEIGGKYVKGTGKSAGKHAAIKEKQVNELSPATKKSYINKAASDIDNRSYAQGTVDATNTKYNGKNNRKIANRLKGIRRATK